MGFSDACLDTRTVVIDLYGARLPNYRPLSTLNYTALLLGLLGQTNLETSIR
jgi:hypothetical protein